MTKKSKFIQSKGKKGVDLHDIYDLIEMGLDKEEISKEFGISKKYIKKMIEDYYEDY
ncbi:hypothetical protein CULT_1400015 [[Clostridium] ultunense Esp]|uniref:Resolvase HTH domain-containing protein n=1 Tax=[Clostridium] ultunense Esp TaxID=1288971 RepID=M1Z773_9FIRM|nr:hypothetical protein [Schnuerera ultunensis]CCQ93584.1 hypothetical protein CULT_1400015 [[Clostridium] ultunense Esp]SHD76904.1 conserved protein of unknown function [[Clostridium] ultunense Esp]